MNSFLAGRYVRGAVFAAGLLAFSAGATETVGAYVDPTWLFLGSVVAATWFGGLAVGLATVAASTALVDYLVVAPQHELNVDLASLPRLTVYAAVAAGMAWLSEAKKKADQAAAMARSQLEIRVQEKTTDLERANRDLLWQTGLLDLTHDTIMVRDRDDRITYWNRGAEEMYGWTRSEALGRVSHELLRTVFPAPLPEILRVLEKTGRWDGELIHTHRNDTPIHAASRWAVARDAEGRLSGILETNNDVSVRRRAEESLRKARADLAHASRVMMMGELTASIAHEINQPLCAVVANGNAALRWLNAETPDLGEVGDAIRRIVRDGNRASEVITRIRGMVHKAAPRRAAFDISDLIHETLKVADFELTRKRIVLVKELAAGLPLVTGDFIQLQQLLLNLLLNAADAMEASPAEERMLRIESGLDSSGAVRISVHDSGIGVKPADLDRIFSTFYTTKPSGMGMGLSISRSIARAHGGDLWAQSNEGSGATFHFTVGCDQTAASPMSGGAAGAS